MDPLIVRVVEAPKQKKNYLQALISLVTAVVAVSGIVLSCITANMTKKQNDLQRKLAYSELFTKAYAHLRDESLAVRCGATNEFKRLAIESPEDRDMILRILAKFVHEGIQNTPRWEDQEGCTVVEDDIFLAADVLTLLFSEYNLCADLAWVDAHNLALDNISLQGARMEYANFQGAYLNGAQFQGAYLYQANLLQALLSDANFQGADISGVDFQGANLFEANFRGANLSWANFQGAVGLQDANFQEATLWGANLQEVDLLGANFQGANLSRANLHGAELFINDFQGTDLSGANLQGVDLSYAENLTAKQVLDGKKPAYIDSTTQFADELRNDPRIQAQIKNCEKFADYDAWAQAEGVTYMY